MSKAKARATLFSVSYIALGVFSSTETRAQTAAPQGQAESQLPPIQITAPEAKRRASSDPAQRVDGTGQRRRSQAARNPEPQAAPKAFAVSQDARTGTVG